MGKCSAKAQEKITGGIKEAELTLRGNFKAFLAERDHIFCPDGFPDHVTSLEACMMGYDKWYECTRMYSGLTWLGVNMQMDPNDAFVLQELLWLVKPDLVIELGTNDGGSAFFYAHIMSQYAPHGKVVTLDPLPAFWARTENCSLVSWDSGMQERMLPFRRKPTETGLWASSVHFICAEPEKPTAVAEVKGFVDRAERVLVVEDSTHQSQMVRRNLENYAQFVSPGSYLVVQDTKISRWGNTEGPLAAIDDFLASEKGSDFVTDRNFEYLLYSQHHKGFLRRRK